MIRLRARCLIAPVFVASAIAQTASLGSLQLAVSGSSGETILGATISYQRVVPYVHSGGNVVPAPGETVVTGAVTADSTGALPIQSLPAGTYNLCVAVTSAAYLNPCVWGQAITATVSVGATANQTIVLQKGVYLNVTVNDPAGLLAQPLPSGRPRRLLVGVVYGSGAYQGADIASAGSSGRTYQLAIPAGKPFQLWVFSRDVTLANPAGNPIARGGLVPFQAVAGQDQAFTLSVAEAGPAK